MAKTREEERTLPKTSEYERNLAKTRESETNLAKTIEDERNLAKTKEEDRNLIKTRSKGGNVLTYRHIYLKVICEMIIKYNWKLNHNFVCYMIYDPFLRFALNGQNLLNF